MERRSSATSCLNFFGTLASMFLATWTWQRWMRAWENSSLKTASSPGKPSIIPKVIFWASKPLTFRSLKNSRQTGADSLSPDCMPTTNLSPSSFTPTATKTGTFSTLLPMRMGKWTPSTNRYFTGSQDKSRCRHRSTASDNSTLTELISVGDIFRPIRRSEIIERVRVLTPPKNRTPKSRPISFSYCLLLGMTAVLNSPLRSRGNLTWTSPIFFKVKKR